MKYYSILVPHATSYIVLVPYVTGDRIQYRTLRIVNSTCYELNTLLARIMNESIHRLSMVSDPWLRAHGFRLKARGSSPRKNGRRDPLIGGTCAHLLLGMIDER